MKPILVFAVVALLIVFQLSCAKSYKNIDRTLNGQIVDSVTNDPISNTSFVLDTYDLGGSNRGDTQTYRTGVCGQHRDGNFFN